MTDMTRITIGDIEKVHVELASIADIFIVTPGGVTVDPVTLCHRLPEIINLIAKLLDVHPDAIRAMPVVDAVSHFVTKQ